MGYYYNIVMINYGGTMIGQSFGFLWPDRNGKLSKIMATTVKNCGTRNVTPSRQCGIVVNVLATFQKVCGQKLQPKYSRKKFVGHKNLVCRGHNCPIVAKGVPQSANCGQGLATLESLNPKPIAIVSKVAILGRTYN